jgi:hypothetical protein
MAYMNQEKKAKIAGELKKALAGTGIKYTLGVHNHSTICMRIKSAPIDFIKNFNETVAQRPGGFRTGNEAKDSMDVNPYWYQEHFSGKALKILKTIMACMYGADWYDRSDIQTDYFDTAYYVSVSVGQWNKPFEVIS